MIRDGFGNDYKAFYDRIDARKKIEELLIVDRVAQIIIFAVIWFAGCAIVAHFDDLHDAYKMLIGFVFGTVGVFVSGMNKY